MPTDIQLILDDILGMIEFIEETVAGQAVSRSWWIAVANLHFNGRWK